MTRSSRFRPNARPFTDPNRKPNRWCALCASLAHRVEGAKCRGCGLMFRDLEPVVLEFSRGNSSVARCQESA